MTADPLDDLRARVDPTVPAVVFASMSLAHDAARSAARVPVEMFRPIERGMLEDVVAPGRVVVIIDGAFHSRRAVAPYEIMSAMRAGALVLGASSMGALRAAELAEFGMMGVGEVYRLYRTGEITSDAEVALLFDPTTGQALTEPLVNVRYALDRLGRAGVLPPDAVGAAVGVATGIHYHDLTYETLFRRLEGVLPPDVLGRARAYLHDHADEVNLKRLDALAAIDCLNSLYPHLEG